MTNEKITIASKDMVQKINKAYLYSDLRDCYDFAYSQNLLTEDVLKAFLQNEFTPPFVIRHIHLKFYPTSSFTECQEDILKLFAENPNTSSEILRDIHVLSNSEEVRQAALDNPNFPQNTKEALAKLSQSLTR